MFLVSSFQETSFNKKPFDLRDKKILKFDRDKADALIAIARGPSSIELARDRQRVEGRQAHRGPQRLRAPSRGC